MSVLGFALALAHLLSRARSLSLSLTRLLTRSVARSLSLSPHCDVPIHNMSLLADDADGCFLNTRFFYKQRVYKHTQPQIREILSTLLSTPPASDFEIDNEILKNCYFFPKFQKRLQFFSKILKQ